MKRNKLQIIRDILKIIQENKNSIRITPLLRKSGLSSKRFYKYLEELENKKLVKKNTEKEISLTENGFKYIEKYKRIVDFIEEFEL